MGRKFRHRSVFVKLFISYLLIMGLILVIETGVSASILHTSWKQAETLNQSLLQLVKSECDNQIESICSNLDQLALESKVQVLSNVKAEFQPEDQYTAYSLYSELQSISFSLREYELLYVYFQNTDSVISLTGNMSLQMYYDLYYKKYGISLEELRSFLCGKHYHDIRILSSGSETEEIMYTMTSLKTAIGIPSATIVIQISSDAVDSRINSAKWDEDILVAVMNSKNEFLNRVEVGEELEGLVYEELPGSSSFTVSLNGEKYMGIAMESEAADWVYMMLTPKRIIESSVKQVERICLLGMGICLIVGFFFSYYLTGKNYHPIKGLMDLFGRESADHAEALAVEMQNEYQWLENQTETLFKKNKDIQQALAQNQLRLREFYLYKLLSHPYEEMDDAECRLLRNGGILDGILRVVFLSVGAAAQASDGGKQETEEQELSHELKRFIIRNVAGEALNEVFPSELLDVGDHVIAVIRLDAMNTDTYDRMWGALAKAYDLIRDKFHFYMQICAGTAKEGLENVHFSYLEAKETQEYAPLLETYFINYNDIKNRSRKYDYPTETEARIIAAISEGMPEPAMLSVREVLRVNYQENHITARMLSCLAYDLLGTLMKSADLAGCSDFFEKNWTDLEHVMQGTPEEMGRRFDRLITELCREVEKVKNGGGANLVDKIQSYVQKNYQNPDLNISQIALYLGKTPAYISSVYKKQTGRSLLKFINQMRIDLAVGLLREGKSVNETALLSGFRDSRSFIRVFKECTGMTPGQMKRE